MRVLFTLIFCSVAHLGFGQKDTIFELPTVEITAVRLPFFAVGQRTITFDSVDLSTFQHRSLADFLAENTPLDLRFYSQGLTTLSTRGGGSAHTAFIWNGLNLQNSLTGGLDLSNISMSNLSSVGYKTGGESALFGGGALSGVVFFDHEIAQKKGFHGQISAFSGSFGDFRQRAQASMGNGRVASNISFGHQKADNNFTFRNTAAIGRPFQKQVNSSTESYNFLQTNFAQISTRTVLTTNFWLQKNNRQIAPTIVAADNKARQSDNNLRFVAELAHQTGRGLLHLRAALTDDFLIYNSNNVVDSRNRAQNRLAEANFESKFFRNWSSQSGVNLTQNIAKSNNFDAQKKRNRISIFSAQVIDCPRVKWSFSMRKERVDSRFVPFTWSAGFEQKNPLFARVFGQKNALKLRGSVARNYNLPALNDLYWAGLGNPELRAESSFSGEFGLDLIRKSAQFPDFSRALHLTFYAMDIQNRIQWSPGLDGIWRPSNLFQSQSRGIETAFSAQQKRANWWFKFRSAYQFTRAVNADDFQLLYVPRHTAQAAFTVQHRGLRFVIRQIFNGERAMTADNSINTKSFALTNLESSWSKKIRNNQLFVQFSIQNLFNKDYQIINYYAMPRRNLLAQLVLSF